MRVRRARAREQAGRRKRPSENRDSGRFCRKIADIQDRAAVPLRLSGAAEQFPQIEHLWVDQGYAGDGKGWIEDALAGASRWCGTRLTHAVSGYRAVIVHD